MEIKRKRIVRTPPDLTGSDISLVIDACTKRSNQETSDGENLLVKWFGTMLIHNLLWSSKWFITRVPIHLAKTQPIYLGPKLELAGF